MCWRFQGGIKAVVWTDVFQALVMVAGIIAVIIVVSRYNPISYMHQHHRDLIQWLFLQGLVKIGGASFFEEIQTRNRFQFQYKSTITPK